MTESVAEMAVNGLQLQPPVQGSEKLYGWYPPAYPHFSKPSYKQLGSYEEEARFRHQSTHFHNPPSGATQQESSAFHRPPTIMSHRSSQGARSSDSAQRSGAALSSKMDGIRQEMLRRQMETPLFKRLTPERPGSAASGPNVFNYQSEKCRKTQRPVFSAVPAAWRVRYPEPDLRRCWSPVMTVESSRASVASSISLPTPPPDLANQQLPSSVIHSDQRPATPVPDNTNSAEKHLESAAGQRRTGRPKTAPALLRRQMPASPTPGQQQSSGSGQQAMPQHRIPTSYQRQVAAMTALVPAATELTPAKEEEEEATREELEEAEAAEVGSVVEEGAEERRELTVDDILDDPYDKALKIHGWRMEVHGDPLGIKSKVLRKRLPYTVKVPEPQVLPQPPRMVKENRETFFQRTLPNGAMTFDINPDFPSERFNAKRQELQRKGLWNYAYRDFSFVY